MNIHEIPLYLAEILEYFTMFKEIDAERLAELAGIHHARASDYLNSLERYGYLTRRREGHRVFFSLNPPVSKEMTDRIKKRMLSDERLEERLQKARTWLIRIQNKDGGWGDHAWEMTSNLTNTAEVIEALLLLGESKESETIRRAVAFIRQELMKPSEVPTFARDWAWIGMALLRVAGKKALEVEQALSWLEKYQEEEGCWDNRSTYSTAIALDLLSSLSHEYLSVIEKAKNWLLKTFKKNGWGTRPGGQTDLAVTAHAIFSLNLIGCKDSRVEIARRFLLRETDRWLIASEDAVIRGGTMFFRHFPLACIIIALLSIGESPVSKKISSNVFKLLQLQDEAGGWSACEGEKPRTWATLNAVMAFNLYRQKLRFKEHS